MTNPNDQCATCSHLRCMAQFVEAAQHLAHSIATVRDALADTMRATSELYSAMQLAGLIPDEPYDAQSDAGKHAARITHWHRGLTDQIHAPSGRWPAPTDLETTTTIPAYQPDEQPEQTPRQGKRTDEDNRHPEQPAQPS